jgi:Ser/Thr protein kinase RdoA (MazF antagonist)
MDERQILRILQMYGITSRTIGQPQKGYRNSSHYIETTSGQELNLILYKSEQGIVQRIHNANAVGAAAAQMLPARTLADARILQLKAGGKVAHAALYHYLPGKTIPWEAYTKEHIKQLGGILATLHTCLKRYNVANLPDVASENAALWARMTHYFNDASVVAAAAQKLRLRVICGDFTWLLNACRHLPNQQALHMDFVRGNILFDGTTITGIIDFEKTGTGSPLFDIARTLAFLLVDCKNKPDEKIRKYFLRSGYIKRGCGELTTYTSEGQNIFERLIDFFLLHDLYKFMHHNPYEALIHNEHYMRTKALLLKRRLIAEV